MTIAQISVALQEAKATATAEHSQGGNDEKVM
jgi:hypothetical protein